jgi:hypothetical protein
VRCASAIVIIALKNRFRDLCDVGLWKGISRWRSGVQHPLLAPVQYQVGGERRGTRLAHTMQDDANHLPRNDIFPQTVGQSSIWRGSVRMLCGGC